MRLPHEERAKIDPVPRTGILSAYEMPVATRCVA